MLHVMPTSPRTLALATPHVAATEAGREAFADGGTAVDAALAACATLAVVYPHMCSIGGDAIALLHAPDGTVTTVNGSGAAPAALDAARVRASLERDPAPVTRAGMPVRGPHTITVPGVLAAWDTLRGLGGALDFDRLLRPAIAHAADGCAVSRSLAATLAGEPELFAADPGLRHVFFRDDGGGVRPLTEGEVFRLPALADSLGMLARDGVDAFYCGELGARYVAGLRAAGSVMTAHDLAAHATEVAAPLAGTAFGHEFLTAPPNSQGYVLLQILGALQLLADDLPDPLGPAAAAFALVFRHVSKDRDVHLCDPRIHEVPLSALLGDDRLRALAAEATRFVATSYLSPAGGAFDGVTGTTASGAAPVAPDPAAGDTIACVAADSNGWAVSIIQSVYQGFGAAILDPATGIVAHDRGACFSLDADSPNVLEGGKRPLHTLMPVMVRRNGRLAIVAGTMGGEAQPQIHAQILSRLLHERVEAGESATRSPTVVADAVAAPRWIQDEDALLIEADVPDPCLDALRETGMPLELLKPVDETVGHAQYIRIHTDGTLEAGTDPRADGAAFAGDA